VVTLMGWWGIGPGVGVGVGVGVGDGGGRFADWFGDGISMKANTGLAAAMTGLAVLLSSLGGRRSRGVAAVLGGLVALAAALTLSEHITGVNLGIDEMLAKEVAGAKATAAPGRMGLPASTSFVLLGLSTVLAWLSRGPGRNVRAGRAAVTLATLACAVSSASLMGHLFGANAMYAIPGLTGIALQTASMLLVLSLGVMCTLPERAPVRVLTDRGTSGVLARRAILAVVVLPVGLGWLRTQGERAGYFDAPTGRSLLLLSLISLLLWLLFWAAAVIRRREVRAIAAERAGDVRYRTLFNSIDQGFCILDVIFEGERPVDYRVVEVNEAYEAQTGLSNSVGKRVTELVADVEASWVTRYARVAVTGEPVRFEKTVGSLGRVFDIYAFRLAREEGESAGGPGRVAVLFSDITQRRRDEEALRAHRERLEELVNERTAELERSQGNLRRAERLSAMGTLAAGLGHDLANLLLPMRLRLEALERSGLSPAAKEDVEGVKEGVKYMKRLASGLRQLAADPSAKPPREGTDLADWWQEAEGMVKAVLPRYVRLESGLGACELPRVAISRVALTQAVFNLVQNAGEALMGREDGCVAVNGRATSDGAVEITVNDDGPGMPPEVVARCFEPYFSTKGRAVSTGMGLVLVRGVTTSVGGTVSVRSTPGAGTVFTMRLPVAEGAGVLHHRDAEAQRRD
jgi:signal transduction histidine kinase